MKLPEKGWSKSAVLDAIRERNDRDSQWKTGRMFARVFYGGEDLLDVLYEASKISFSGNALDASAFPSLRQMETDVLHIAANLLGDDEARGSMSSGGSESLMLAVKAARDWAREHKPHVTKPKMIMPLTAHPALDKAGAYLNVEVVHAPFIEGTYKADVQWIADHIDDDTILLVGSAPQYPHGVIDPITDIAALALKHGILCHVDACVGGFMLPFVKKLGYDVPAWDFSTPGVTSISADLHKYGYAAKGASVVMYKTRELRKHQFVTYADWPCGLYGTATVAGTRAGGPIAAAWAALHFLGEEGYMRLNKASMDVARGLIEGIPKIEGLRIMGKPDCSLVAFEAVGHDIYAVAEHLVTKGWTFERLQRPAGLHVTVTAVQEGKTEELLREIREASDLVRTSGAEAEGLAAMYGMMATMDDRMAVKDFILSVMDSFD
jgi:glutamate/tyrosine decarboxylase-like PLP-dependent enzyme